MMLKTGIVILIIIGIVFVLSGCKQTTTSSYDKDRIEQIMYDIHLAYEQNDINNLLQNFHLLYLHNGQTMWQIEQVWLNRRSEYPLIEFQNISIVVHDDEATVSFTMKLEKPGEIISSSEPNANGDLSYFIYDDDKWQVYGNQHR
jgi:hypothetical protein